MTTINNTVTLTIGGVDRTAFLRRDSLYVRSSVGNRGDSASFTIVDQAGSYSPQEWEPVTIAINGVAVFGGYITDRNVRGIGSGSDKVAEWSIDARDWSVIFDSVFVDERYTDTADSVIVSNLFATYFPTDSFNAYTNIATVNGDLDIGLSGVTFREALDTVAALSGAQWYVAPTKMVYWYERGAPGNAAFNIDTVTPNGTTTFDVLAGSLKRRIDAGSIVNRVRVIGGYALGDKTTETFAANGTKDTFGPLAYRPGSGWLVQYTVGGVLKKMYTTNIGYEPQDRLYADGGTRSVVINAEDRTVKIRTGGGAVPDNATNVTVTYYRHVLIDTTVDDSASQSFYGRTFVQTVRDEKLTSVDAANTYAQTILADYANGKETIGFDVAEHGLTPGTMIAITAPSIGLNATQTNYLLLEDGSYLLLENGSGLLLESTGQPRTFQIQSVTIKPIYTTDDGFMIVASVSCGSYVRNIADSLATVSDLSASGAISAQSTSSGRISDYTNDLGEVVAGRAVFTDGGSAAFTWDDYGDHTGAVVGLDDSTTDLRGAALILQDGTVRAKLGYLDGLPTVNGVAPTGWGLYTTNGYFSGVVTASQFIGGTVATSAPPINSSNPGVYMDATGLYGYGTAGLTFRLSSDPAIKPYFSSGTILNTVYEVNTQSVIRTSASNPRVQMDNSGIFAYNSAGSLKFSVDATTGAMTASDGTFSGTVTASQVSGGTVTGSRVTGGTITGVVVTANTISGGTITGAAINANTITGGTVTGSRITGGTITGVAISANTISGGTVSGALVTGGTVSGGRLTGTVNANGLKFIDILGGTIADTSGLNFRVQNLMALQHGTSIIGTNASAFAQLALASPDGNTFTLSITNLGSIQITKVAGGATRYV